MTHYPVLSLIWPVVVMQTAQCPPTCTQVPMFSPLFVIAFRKCKATKLQHEFLQHCRASHPHTDFSCCAVSWVVLSCKLAQVITWLFVPQVFTQPYVYFPSENLYDLKTTLHMTMHIYRCFGRIIDEFRSAYCICPVSPPSLRCAYISRWSMRALWGCVEIEVRKECVIATSIPATVFFTFSVEIDCGILPNLQSIWSSAIFFAGSFSVCGF